MNYVHIFLCYSDKLVVASLCHCPSFSLFVFFKHSFQQKDMLPTLWLMLLWMSSWMLFCCTTQKAIPIFWTKYLCQILGPLLSLRFDASTLFILHDTMLADMASCRCQWLLMNKSLYTYKNLQEVQNKQANYCVLFVLSPILWWF